LGDGRRAVTLEFLAALDGKAGDAVEVEIGGNFEVFEPEKFLRLLVFPVYIPFIFNGYFDGFHDIFAVRCSTWNTPQNIRQTDGRTRHQVGDLLGIRNGSLAHRYQIIIDLLGANFFDSAKDCKASTSSYFFIVSA
jgi:hypothetical protein